MSLQMSNAKKTNGKPLLVIGWFFMTFLILFAISYEDKYFAISGVPVATVSQLNRDVTVRSEDDIRWRPSKLQQGLFDGDKLATGADSGAVINFGDGKKGVLGPDTIVSINSIKQKNGKSFIVNLIKGGIKPVVQSGSNGQLIVTSGVSTFYVEPGESKAFSKSMEGSLKEFNSKDKFPKVNKNSTASQAKFVLPVALVSTVEKLPTVEVAKTAALVAEPVEIVEEELAPTPTATPTPKPVVKKAPQPTVKPVESLNLEEFLPTIMGDSSQRVYFTTLSLKDISGTIFSSSLAKSSKPTNSKIEIGLEASIGGSKILYLADENGVVNVKVAKGQVLASRGAEMGAAPCSEVVLKPYAAFSGEGANKKQFANEAKTIKVCSMLDAKEKLPLVIGMSSIEAPINSPKFFSPASLGTAFPFQFVVTNVKDYIKLIPYLRSASAFKIISGKGLTPQGIFGVASNGASIQFVGAGFNPENLNTFLGVFNLNYIFRGSKDAVYDAGKMNLENFKKWVSENTERGKSVYLPLKGNLVLVSSNFMTERPEVANFVRRASKILFLDKIEIIVFKE